MLRESPLCSGIGLKPSVPEATTKGECNPLVVLASPGFGWGFAFGGSHPISLRQESPSASGKGLQAALQPPPLQLQPDGDQQRPIQRVTLKAQPDGAGDTAGADAADHRVVRWTGLSGQPPSLTSEPGYCPIKQAWHRLLGRQNIWNQLKAEAADFGEVLVPYSLRHRFSYEGHRLGIAAKDLSQAMGHSLECHLRAYARFTSNETANAFANATARLEAVLQASC